ncbi:MAG: hypothetical protein GX130_02480 [Candidatus Hydrogenedens sp.]|jgi:hypothetical protein|nr:hypothetical protein [Candidatus Hydrogenedens sp.]
MNAFSPSLIVFRVYTHKYHTGIAVIFQMHAFPVTFSSEARIHFTTFYKHRRDPEDFFRFIKKAFLVHK